MQGVIAAPVDGQALYHGPFVALNRADHPPSREAAASADHG